jgi:hypothetical protein
MVIQDTVIQSSHRIFRGRLFVIAPTLAVIWKPKHLRNGQQKTFRDKKREPKSVPTRLSDDFRDLEVELQRGPGHTW